MRTASIDSVVENYAAVIQSLEEARSVKSDSRAIGLLDRFQKGATLLGLHMALVGFRPLEQLLCKSSQSLTRSVSGMLQAVDSVKRELNRMRTMEFVTNMLSEVKRIVDELNLDEIVLPRRRQPPERFCGSAEQHHAQSTEVYYRLEFFKLVDTVQVQHIERFGVDKVGLRQYRCLEEILLTGDVSDVVDAYPEIHPKALQIELAMFRHQISYGSTMEAVLRMQEMTPEV